MKTPQFEVQKTQVYIFGVKWTAIMMDICHLYTSLQMVILNDLYFKILFSRKGYAHKRNPSHADKSHNSKDPLKRNGGKKAQIQGHNTMSLLQLRCQQLPYR